MSKKTAVIRKKEHFKMVWKKDASGNVRWIQTIEDQFEDDALSNLRILELIMTEKIANRGLEGEKSYQDARQIDHILRHVYNVDTSDLDRAYNYYRSLLGWYEILDIDPQEYLATHQIRDQELKPESEQDDESADDNHITVHDEDTDIADNPIADDWMDQVMNEVMKFNREHGRDNDQKNNGNE